jgi:hypothetical protein
MRNDAARRSHQMTGWPGVESGMAGNDQVPPTARPDTRLTCDEFLLFPDDGKRHELIDGIHYVTPSPNLRHQDLAGRLHLAIGSYLAAHPGTGRLFERTCVRE